MKELEDLWWKWLTFLTKNIKVFILTQRSFLFSWIVFSLDWVKVLILRLVITTICRQEVISWLIASWAVWFDRVKTSLVCCFLSRSKLIMPNLNIHKARRLNKYVFILVLLLLHLMLYMLENYITLHLSFVKLFLNSWFLLNQAWT